MKVKIIPQKSMKIKAEKDRENRQSKANSKHANTRLKDEASEPTEPTRETNVELEKTALLQLTKEAEPQRQT